MKIKRRMTIMLITGLLSVGLYCDQATKNPGKPLNQDYGRTIPLEIEKITRDDGENFYFNRTSHIKAAADDCFYVLDKDQFLTFSPDGKFVKNLMKKGQGAGEVVSISNYLLSANNEILFHNHYPCKVIKIDATGKLLHEKRIHTNKYLTLIHQDRDKYFFLNQEAEDTGGKAKMVEVDIQILSVLKSDLTITKVFSFPVINFALKTSGAFGLIRTTPLLLCSAGENRFFISHTSAYGVKLIDLDSRKTLMEFSRKYKRVEVTEENKKFLMPGHFILNGKLQKPPEPEYLNDIQSIHYVNGNLWVFTSSVDEAKGVLVDVFDKKGKYIDCFYMKFQFTDSNHKLAQDQVTVANNSVYLIEQDEEGNWMITKYRLQTEEKGKKGTSKGKK